MADAGEVRDWAMRHGGTVQRMMAAYPMPGDTVAGRRPLGGSFQFEALIMLWSLGVLPAHALQLIAASAEADGGDSIVYGRFSGDWCSWPIPCKLP